jgi:hypothetical protein
VVERKGWHEEETRSATGVSIHSPQIHTHFKWEGYGYKIINLLLMGRVKYGDNIIY